MHAFSPLRRETKPSNPFFYRNKPIMPVVFQDNYAQPSLSRTSDIKNRNPMFPLLFVPLISLSTLKPEPLWASQRDNESLLCWRKKGSLIEKSFFTIAPKWKKKKGVVQSHNAKATKSLDQITDNLSLHSWEIGCGRWGAALLYVFEGTQSAWNYHSEKETHF